MGVDTDGISLKGLEPKSRQDRVYISSVLFEMQNLTSGKKSSGQW